MRKKLTAVVLAVLVFSLIAASAASLGGIAVPNGPGADAVTVNAACDINDAPDAAPGTENLAASFRTTWDVAEYVVDQVTITGIDDTCVSQRISVTLTQAGAADAIWGSAGMSLNGSPNDNVRSFAGVTGIDADSPFDLYVSIAA